MILTAMMFFAFRSRVYKFTLRPPLNPGIFKKKNHCLNLKSYCLNSKIEILKAGDICFGWKIF